MAAFEYHALTHSGNSKKGVIEADSERQAKEQLSLQGLMPTKIQPIKKHNRIQQTALKTKDLALITRQLATLFSSGIPLETALHSLSEQTATEKIRALILQIKTKILEGHSLAQAMANYPKAFKKLYCATIAAGEHTGRLDLVLHKLADYTERQQFIRNKIQHALIYPTLMITVAVGIIIFLLIFVVPQLIGVFANSGQKLPYMTRCLINISEFNQHHSISLLLIFMLLVISLKISWQNKRARKKIDEILLKIPLIAYLIRAINLSRYMHTFSILFESGVNVLESMKVAASLITNTILSNCFA